MHLVSDMCYETVFVFLDVRKDATPGVGLEKRKINLARANLFNRLIAIDPSLSSPPTEPNYIRKTAMDRDFKEEVHCTERSYYFHDVKYVATANVIEVVMKKSSYIENLIAVYILVES